MLLKAKKSQLKGSISIPASKSHTIRAVAIASLAKGISYIRNPLFSSDTISVVKCYRALGAEIDTSDKAVWKVEGLDGKIIPPKSIIDVGNSGTTLTIAIGSASLIEKGKTVNFTGDEQIQNRPVGELLESLRQLGAQAESIKDNGNAPVLIGGQLTGGKTSIKCITSQFLSSLLLACPLAQNDTEITVPLLYEPDYAKMTVDWLNWQGIKFESSGLQQFLIKGGQKYRQFDMPMPADFSSATFFLCAAAILKSTITIENLDFNDSQPDKAVVDYLKQMGAVVNITPQGTIISAENLVGTEIDMNRTPDALPAMAVVGAFAEGETRLVNVPQARVKETDRIKCMAEELKKLNVDITELEDGLIIRKSNLKPAELDGRGDHRIVMALSLAAMAIDQPSEIAGAEAMNVTFPTFVELMQKLGGAMSIED